MKISLRPVRFVIFSLSIQIVFFFVRRHLLIPAFFPWRRRIVCRVFENLRWDWPDGQPIIWKRAKGVRSPGEGKNDGGLKTNFSIPSPERLNAVN
jgi:hypothetical protein